MNRMNTFLVLVLVGSLVAVARPQEKKKKDRVVHDKDLSEEEHFSQNSHEHNPEYDHEAFVGEEEARKFEELTPEQSKERLRKIVKRIDKDQDGFVSEEELKNWIKFTQNRYVWEDAERQMTTNDADKDGLVTWEEYKNSTYGFLDESSENEANYKDMIRRDKRRFDKADKDGDGKLTKEEFVAFLHPENNDSMKDIVVEETMEDIDKDKDGYLSLEEYIGDLWPEEDRKKGVEPDWVKTEREQFSQFRDTNKDGRMDMEEVKAWILPPEFDHVSSEAKHLISESDVDKDGKLSENEIVEKYDLFVGSQATDFGEALKRHDEF